MNPQVLTVTLNPAIDWTVAVQNLAVGEVNRAKGDTLRAGGKGINVAAVLADAGVSVAATGFLGRENEAPFQHLFAQRGIGDRMIRLDGATRTGIKVVSEAEHETTDINFPGLALGAGEMAVLKRELESTSASWVVLAGSIPPGVNADVYLSLTHQVKKRGCKVVLDASGQALQKSLDAHANDLPDLIKPNLAELEEWAGTRLETPEAVCEVAQGLVKRGIEQVAVSMGSQGALLVSCQGAVWATPPRIEVGSTVGAGDALVAGLVVGSLRGLSQEETLRLATAFSLGVLTQSQSYSVFEEAITHWRGRIEVRPMNRNRGSPYDDLLAPDSLMARSNFIRATPYVETPN